MTPIQELIKEFEFIKENHCKSIHEMFFFDGVLAIIETKYLDKEKEVLKNTFFENSGVDNIHDYQNEFNEYYNNL